MFPWIDYGGRFSPLRAVVFAALFAPALYVFVAYSMGWLGARPTIEAIHQIGLWTIRFIFLALTMSPARRLLNWPRLIEVRRMIGVAACCYVLLHFLLYMSDEMFDLPKIASEIVLRIYLTIGFTALLGLVALASTSTDGMVRRLGRRWQTLHNLIYVIGVLAITHFFMQSKADVWEPLWMAGLFLWLMGWRLLDRWAPRSGVPLWQVGLLGIAASVLTGLGEAVYYALYAGAPLDRLIAANWMTDIGVRPSWVVLGVSAVITAAAALRPVRKRAGPSPERNRASAVRGA